MTGLFNAQINSVNREGGPNDEATLGLRDCRGRGHRRIGRRMGVDGIVLALDERNVDDEVGGVEFDDHDREAIHHGDDSASSVGR